MEKILISAGEESGDLYASLFVKEIKKQKKDIKVIAFGGDGVKKAGADLKINLLKIAIIGFWEVVLNLFNIISVLIKAEKILKEEKPDILVVVDFPGFHLWLIKKARELGVKKIIYWITPQVWAWKYERIKIIKKYCDFCIVVFPFEKKVFEKEGIRVKYFGHPITEVIKNIKCSRSQRKNIGIFPGSRENEIKSFLPEILKSCVLIKEQNPDAFFLLFKSKSVSHYVIKKYLDKYSQLNIKILNGDDYSARKSLVAAIVKSGTITLENALLGIPMVVVYKLSFISYLITKKLLKIKFISLPNIIAGRKIVSELIQHNFTAKKICDNINQILKDKKYYNFIKNEYKKIKNLIYKKNIIKNSVKTILKEN